MKTCRCRCDTRHPGVVCAEEAQPGRYGGFRDPEGKLYFARLCRPCGIWWARRNGIGLAEQDG